jgi:FkbM family methyltransferase
MISLVFNNTKYAKMMYNKYDFAFVSELNKGFIYEENLIETHLSDLIKKSNIILDIGSHCGSHSIIYSKINPNAQIYAFEPQEKMFKILNMNISINNITNIKTYNLALGNKKCLACMDNICKDGPNINIDINNPDIHFNLGGLQIGINGEPIVIDILDNFNFGKIDFIKIDVEGFESFVIDGGINSIIKYKPFIFFENNSKTVTTDMKNYYNKIDYSIFDKLTSLNYIIKQLDGDNYLAIPN